MIKLALLTAATLALGAGPALAKDGSWQVGNDEFHLNYHNIDMNTVAGRATMLAHVERAAGKLCSDRALLVDQRECVRSIVASAAANDQNKRLALAVDERRGIALAAR